MTSFPSFLFAERTLLSLTIETKEKPTYYPKTSNSAMATSPAFEKPYGTTIQERSLNFNNRQSDASTDTGSDKPIGLSKPDSMISLKIDQGMSLNPEMSLLEFISPRPLCELNNAATMIQKVYKSNRTRRHLADCAVIVEELWYVFHCPNQ